MRCCSFIHAGGSQATAAPLTAAAENPHAAVKSATPSTSDSRRSGSDTFAPAPGRGSATAPRTPPALAPDREVAVAVPTPAVAPAAVTGNGPGHVDGF